MLGKGGKTGFLQMITGGERLQGKLASIPTNKGDQGFKREHRKRAKKGHGVGAWVTEGLGELWENGKS